MREKPRLSFWQIWNMCFGFLGIQFGFALQNANVSRIFQMLGALWVAAGMLWISDVSINLSMEPFRAFVGDQLSPQQRPSGYVMQSFFIGVGSIVASMPPFILEKCGVANTAEPGHVPGTVKFAFYAGGVVMLSAILWTVLRSKEHSPQELAQFNDYEPPQMARTAVEGRPARSKLAWVALSSCVFRSLLSVMANFTLVGLKRRVIAVSVMALPFPNAFANDYYGTLEPFAKRAVYFLMTDRFVNGDPRNDQRDQGGSDPALHTFDRPVPGAPPGENANIGYLGGDFKGIENNADYIKELGFDAIWLTPIVDNPDQAFTGGDAVTWKGRFQDKGKTGYHGYWGSNFTRVDEHLPSVDLDFGMLTYILANRGISTVLDIVANHGSPSFGMPVAQPKFGQLFDAKGNLIADHQNLPAAQLAPAHNPLHRFYNSKTEMVQLSDLNENNPAVMDYLSNAYINFIDDGASAFRIDTIKHMPLTFWREFSARIRAYRPGFFMFADAFDYDANKLAPFTWPENGGITVLDFPMKERLDKVFSRTQAGFETLEDGLHLDDGLYQDPYTLMTFYDNHDMPRMDASDNGFIDAHNWLFTARGIPVIYYGSEIGFMRGKTEHEGNRNYFGQERIDGAAANPIYQNLQRIAQLRRETPALQRGLQLNLALKGNKAAFYRVLQYGGHSQSALVLLNKSDTPERFHLKTMLQPGEWRSALNEKIYSVSDKRSRLRITVPAHGVEILLFENTLTEPALIEALDRLQAGKVRRTNGG